MAKKSTKKLTKYLETDTAAKHCDEAAQLDKRTANPVALKPTALGLPAKPPSEAAAQPPGAAMAQRGGVPFVLHEPDAERVWLSGNFNDWSPIATPMERDDAGRWKITVALPVGRHEYKFVVDGQWIPDPNAQEQTSNGYGTLNSVIEVHA